MNQVSERRRRLVHRTLPLAGVALVSLVAGTVIGASTDSASERAARTFASAWEAQDYRTMYGLLSDDARRRYDPAAFRDAYLRAGATATARRVHVGEAAGERDGAIELPVRLATRVFGALSGTVALPVRDERVDWTPNLAFPGLAAGERLSRRSVAPERGTLLAVNGQVLAKGSGSERGSALTVASSIVGTLGPAEGADEREALYARGFPKDAEVGQSGLERVFETQLAGRPGGELRAGTRTIASAKPRRSAPVRSTIDPAIQEAAVTALAGRFGGVAALDARTAEVRALAGVAFSAPQPPGSTFKIVTATAALEAGAVKPSTEFPVESAATIDGVELENANGEFCGGTFQSSFAHSCNSVFAPLGVRIGAQKLVEKAEQFGWNQQPTVPGEVPSTLPPPGEIVSPLEVGSTAIGQFKTLATPFELASVAQTIAADGVRTIPRLDPAAPARRLRVTTRRTARTVARLMVDVVAYGTGTAAAITDVKVAGKTGTAELEDTRDPVTGETSGSDPSNTDAWFTAYAPADNPRIVVAVMLVRAGAGGATAAPAARIVLETGAKDQPASTG
jgi:peptidoglycan glycosyltransferase